MFKEYVAYIKNNPERYWFKRKLFGWGWTPATWEGWVVTGIYAVAVILLAFTIDSTSPRQEVFFTFILPVVLLTIALIRVCYRKGEKPKWQWGLKK
ncbi:hypothetical protein KTR10_02405 [Candidatus Kaiserbacteria bacterium]|nr:hypothetical protein [Candidatus Kaiserbacteria bacterium]